MTIIVNPMALSWKHDSAQGIVTRQNAQGQMELISWPAALGAMPTQIQADAWAAEYAAQDQKDRANAPILSQITVKERAGAGDRRLRETTLAIARLVLPADNPNRMALEAADAEIAALRAQLRS